MKKTINFLCWLSVVLTILAVTGTFITRYNFIYIKYFDTYKALQQCILFTMLFWSIKLYDTNTGKRRLVYALICLFFAGVMMFFILNNSVW